MKTTTITLFTFFFTVNLFASDLPYGKLAPFISDGCSNFPEGTLFRPKLWHHCCVQHDKFYWAGGSRKMRKTADIELRQCVTAEGHKKIAKLIYKGVRIGGTPFVKTSFHWGFGWKKLRGYSSLTEDEIYLLKELEDF